MSEKNHLSLKKFYILFFISSALILIASIEALIQVKDGQLFLQWIEENFPNRSADNELFTQYVSSILSIYFFKVMIPASIAVTAYITATKARFSMLMVYIWSVLAFGGLAYTTADMNLQSIFFYLNGAIYIGLVLYIYFRIGLSRDRAGGED